jgi:hypothetical protein
VRLRRALSGWSAAAYGRPVRDFGVLDVQDPQIDADQVGRLYDDPAPVTFAEAAR